LAAGFLGSFFPGCFASATTRVVHTRGDYAFEIPSDWTRIAGVNAETLTPPGADGRYVRVTLDRYPSGPQSPQTPAAYESALMAAASGTKELQSRRRIKISGKLSVRLAFVATAPPMREIYVIIPFSKDYYYVLRFGGIGKSFAAAKPQFEQILSGLQFHVGRKTHASLPLRP